MDWPLTAALGGLAAAIGVVGVAAVVVLKSDAPAVKRTSNTVAYAVPKPPPPVTPPPQVATTLPELTPYSASVAPSTSPALAPPTAPSTPLPSVVVLGPSPFAPDNPPVNTPPPQRVQPQSLPLPQLKHEPPPKAAKPAVVPPPANKPPPPVETHIKGVMTAAEIARIKGALKLTAEQLPLWHPVEVVLRDIGKQQMIQIRNGAKPEVDSSAMTRVYYAAQGLLATLRPEQKEQVRRLARSMGYGSVASML